MNLEEKSQENLQFMVGEITAKLQVVNKAAMESNSFDLNNYEEIKDLYEMVQSKNQFSVSEMDAIISELGKLKKS
ncbi:Uncharacterized protein YfkK, UPF0435 family [Alteribacillus persepolensis]|uniref:UPF0435 protein SAMN05192534_101180 n=1 Tax=Alteribacillus persepolensis TaxID=568899 RepID=A0A1G7YLY4_9BACI|nr:DUF1128 domain-containing protein [Alteribacillus persepolensis]SDG96830.1 Uncharacterized protein YfkK, UPF0435 family [Alteribacillus persepolensis]